MNTDWQEKLANLDGVDEALSNSQTIDQHALYRSPALVELSNLSVVDIGGPDAKSFLQAQVCNDLTVLGEGQAQINGYCSPKGRLLALFTVFAHLDGYRLLLPSQVAATMVKRLQMFVMRAQVTISSRTDLICSGLVVDAGQSIADIALPDSAPALPVSELSLTSNEQMQCLRWHDTLSVPTNTTQQARYLCIAAPDVLIELWQNPEFTRAPWAYWRWGDINAGIPNVYASSSEQFIPQMLNMQLINALSFKKGCYPGQEIVARMQYLGKLKKHMTHMVAPGVTTAPEPGQVLTTDGNNNAGQIVDAVVDEDGLNLLAVVNINTPINDLKLDDQALQEAPMPYSLALTAEQS